MIVNKTIVVDILYTRFRNPLDNRSFKEFFLQLSPEQQERNRRFSRWQDRHANLFGLQLLLQGFDQLGLGKDELNNIRYSPYKKPFINNFVEFNISHSGEYVVCAIARGTPVGVDIERVERVKYNDFSHILSEYELTSIRQSSDQLRAFYKYWTIRESVVKADGRGLFVSSDLLIIKEKDSLVICEERPWHMQELDIAAGYVAHLATAIKVNVCLKAFDFYQK